MTMTVSGKGIHNVECPVCGFQKKSDEMKKRWDGKWVCPEDWEPRHPMYFFKQRKDTFAMRGPIMAAGNALTFTPIMSAGITGSPDTLATYSTDGTYYTASVELMPTTTSNVAVSANSTIDAPTVVTVAGDGTVLDSFTGKLLSRVTVTLAGKITILTAIPSTANKLLLKCRYT